MEIGWITHSMESVAPAAQDGRLCRCSSVRLASGGALLGHLHRNDEIASLEMQSSECIYTRYSHGSWQKQRRAAAKEACKDEITIAVWQPLFL